MKKLHRATVVEQTTAHLREALRGRRWGEALPGVLRLAGELEVSKDAVRAALRLLEQEGFLAAGGHGKPRRPASADRPALSSRPAVVAILGYRPLNQQNGHSQRFLLNLKHRLEAAGHECFFPAKTQVCLHHDPKRIIRMVRKTKADAWIVDGGSAELLDWFASQELPAIALGGRRSEALIARVGVDLIPAFQKAIRRLIALGHRRIVLICPREWRLPEPGRAVRVVLNELSSIQAVSPDYHVPDWEQTADGFHALLDSLFRVTPPTALVVIEPMQTVAVLSFLAQRGLRIPQDVSLITRTKDASLEWFRPALAHFEEAGDFLERHLVRWAGTAARGKVDRRRIVCSVAFEEGESIAPPPSPPSADSAGL